MDPASAMAIMASDDDIDERLDAADGLASWLDRHGFVPPCHTMVGCRALIAATRKEHSSNRQARLSAEPIAPTL
jgi:hypothetical protein